MLTCSVGFAFWGMLSGSNKSGSGTSSLSTSLGKGWGRNISVDTWDIGLFFADIFNQENVDKPMMANNNIALKPCFRTDGSFFGFLRMC